MRLKIKGTQLTQQPTSVGFLLPGENMIPKNLLIDCMSITPDVIVSLYDVDLSKLANERTILRFHNGVNEMRRSITWQGNVYEPYPILAQGFEKNGKGTSNRPTLTVSNALGLITSLIKNFDDLLGAIVTRHEVLVRFLDACNFENGNNNADPSAEIVSNYLIEQLQSTDNETATFMLALPCESDGSLFPARVIIANTCCWGYRSVECGYTGGAVADEFDNPTGDPTKDKCSYLMSGCKLRYGKHGILPFGGFPSASKLS